MSRHKYEIWPGSSSNWGPCLTIRCKKCGEYTNLIPPYGKKNLRAGTHGLTEWQVDYRRWKFVMGMTAFLMNTIGWWTFREFKCGEDGPWPKYVFADEELNGPA